MFVISLASLWQRHYFSSRDFVELSLLYAQSVLEGMPVEMRRKFNNLTIKHWNNCGHSRPLLSNFLHTKKSNMYATQNLIHIIRLTYFWIYQNAEILRFFSILKFHSRWRSLDFLFFIFLCKKNKFRCTLTK